MRERRRLARARLQRRALQLPRAGARARGARPPLRSRTDTEVVLRAFEEWGPACVERFNGMFAFAVWDERRARALPRARPLRDQAALLRASTAAGCCSAPRSRRCSRPACRRASRREALVEYFTFQNVFSDLTLFEGVRMLPAGHLLTRVAPATRALRALLGPRARAGRVGLARTSGSSACARPSRPRSSASSSATCRVGSYLSGGMDSASIVAVASRADPAPDDVHRRLRPHAR